MANLVKVYNDTLEITTGTRSQKITGLLVNHVPTVRFDDISIDVVNRGCIDVCLDLIKTHRDSKPFLVNFASDIVKGGGVKKGSRAQEEDIFRCTSAGKSIPNYFYPLNPDDAVWSPDIDIVKDGAYNRVEFQRVSLFSIAALRHPKVKDGRYVYKIDRECMRNKIEMMFQTADYYGCIDLVLGAFGCGVFQNPVEEVVEIFKDAINRYRKSFRTITFAVLDNCGDLFKDFRMIKN